MIILFSGYSEFEFARQAVQIGALEYFLKPIDIEALTDRVRKTIRLIEREMEQSSQVQRRYLLDKTMAFWNMLESRGDNNPQEMQINLKELTGFSENTKLCLIVVSADEQPGDHADQMLLMLQERASKVIQPFGGTMITPQKGYSLMLFPMSRQEFKQSCKDTLGKILQQINGISQNQFAQGFSAAFVGDGLVKDLPKLWRKGKNNITNRLWAGGGSIFWDDMDQIPEIIPHINDEVIERSILKLDIDTAAGEIDRLYNSMVHNHLTNRRIVYEATIELKNMLMRGLGKLGIPSHELMNGNDYEINEWGRILRKKR